MDKDFRKEETKKLPEKVLPRIVLPELDRAYTLSEIAIITSAGPARTLGLPQKGHLGIGADADVAIFNVNKNPMEMFSYPRFVIKSGHLIIEEGELRHSIEGIQFASKPVYDEKIEDYLRPLFQQHYTMSFENYPVTEDCIHGLNVHQCGDCGRKRNRGRSHSYKSYFTTRFPYPGMSAGL